MVPSLLARLFGSSRDNWHYVFFSQPVTSEIHDGATALRIRDWAFNSSNEAVALKVMRAKSHEERLALRTMQLNGMRMGVHVRYAEPTAVDDALWADISVDRAPHDAIPKPATSVPSYLYFGSLVPLPQFIFSHTKSLQRFEVLTDDEGHFLAGRIAGANDAEFRELSDTCDLVRTLGCYVYCCEAEGEDAEPVERAWNYRRAHRKVEPQSGMVGFYSQGLTLDLSVLILLMEATGVRLSDFLAEEACRMTAAHFADHANEWDIRLHDHLVALQQDARFEELATKALFLLPPRPNTA